ncbi:MAG: protein arginine kinase [Schwartzia sp.]|nr:protein arginine kinase [Schwartzia sp. (in: firmicutes)]
MSVHDLYRDYRLSWFGRGGAESDVVLASRVRLARNFDRLPFPNRADMKQLAEVQAQAAKVFGDIERTAGQEFDAVGMEGLTKLERQVLAEKRLVSEKLIESPQYRSVYVSQDRRCSVMVNEEDHLRIQCMVPGLDLKTPLAMAGKLDDAIEGVLDLAFDEKMGYLTSCPTNLGTGLRASVLLHLPGLVYTRNMNNIINISQQLGLSVRGFYTEGSEAMGNIFSVSNQLTLGFTETGIIENLTNAATEIIGHERRARKALTLYSKERLEDAVWRAYGVLKYARSLGDSEAMELISKVRLGLDLDLMREMTMERFSELLVASRPGYLQNLAASENLSAPELNRQRADVIRQILSGRTPDSEGGTS